MLAINDIFEQRYKILERAGKGGMGTVYLAMDMLDQKNCAIKEEFITPMNRQLLTSEAEIMGRVRHPAFPQYYGSRELNGFMYIIMEYIDGQTLEEKINEKQRWDEGQIIDWFWQICEALKYLHSLDPPIVYRDFKPSNIMVEASGKIRIIDLGIAQEYTEEGAQVNVAVLTRGYAAPEQYNKRYKLDSRTDIYALAVTIHYLLTGKDPNKPPYEFLPVRKLRKDASYAMEYIIKKCLQPNPDHRYGHVSLLIEDLRQFEALDRKIRSRKKARYSVVAGGCAIALIAAGMIYNANLAAQKRVMEEYYLHIEQAGNAVSLEEALKHVQLAIHISPDNPEAYVACAKLYVEHGQLEQAYSYVNDQIIARFPEIYNNSEFLDLLEHLGEIE